MATAADNAATAKEKAAAESTPQGKLELWAYDVYLSAKQHHVPAGLLWGILLRTGASSTADLNTKADSIAATMAANHHQTNRWDTAVKAASGGKVTDAQATAANKKADINKITSSARGQKSFGAELLEVLPVAVGGVATELPLLASFTDLAVGASGAEAGAGAASAGGAAAGAGGAEAGAGAAAGAGGASAAGGVLSGLSSKLLAGGILGAITASVTGYGTRLLEIVSGGVLVLFGLYVLAKGEAPKVPRFA
jgi:hypothetical protein